MSSPLSIIFIFILISSCSSHSHMQDVTYRYQSASHNGVTIRLNKAALFKSPDSVCIELEVYNESGKDIFYYVGSAPAIGKKNLSVSFGLYSANIQPHRKRESLRIRLVSNSCMIEGDVRYRKIQAGRKTTLRYSQLLNKFKTPENPNEFKKLNYHVEFYYFVAGKAHDIPEPDKNGVYLMSNSYAIMSGSYLSLSGCVDIPTMVRKPKLEDELHK